LNKPVIRTRFTVVGRSPGFLIQRAADWVSDLQGWRRAAVAVLAGAFSVLAFAPVHAWPVLFVTFAVLLWLLDDYRTSHEDLRLRLRASAVTGFWFGFGFFLAGLYWTAEAFLVEPWRHGWLIPFVLTTLPGGMALFFAAAAAFAMLLWRPGIARVLALAIALGLAEFARGHMLTGLPWNLLGYALTGSDALRQLASLFGVYALSLLAVLLFASPAAIFAPHGSTLAGGRATLAMTAALLLALLLGYGWGHARLAGASVAGTDLGVRIVQANVDQANKWRPENSNEIFDTYLALTKQGGLKGVNLVVWPETAVPFLLGETPEALLAIADILPEGTSLLAGSVRLVETENAQGNPLPRRVYNSLLVIDDKGEPLGHYDKTHLVPFGEYLPFQDFLESLGFMQLTGVRGGFSEGTGSRLLEIPGAPPARPLICYEVIFPDEVSGLSERPGWLLSITNDAWFGTSAGPYQHFDQARVRAVEQGLPVVRAANTGISAVIDAYGRVVAKLDLDHQGVVEGKLPQALPPTPFVRFERGIEIGVLSLALFAWFLAAACNARAR
jgi:apolipoprotein N-acyltransferase